MFTNVDVFAAMDGFARLGAAPLTWLTSLKAREISERTGFPWWDCLLLASALELGCTHFLSEDLQEGRIVEGLTLVNPFSKSPGDILSA